MVMAGSNTAIVAPTPMPTAAPVEKLDVVLVAGCDGEDPTVPDFLGEVPDVAILEATELAPVASWGFPILVIYRSQTAFGARGHPSPVQMEWCYAL
jgi:hypothetical protein